MASTEKDLLKVIHYGIIALHNHDTMEKQIMNLSDKHGICIEKLFNNQSEPYD